ncbi:CDP-alcohol phosphatidyltransferase family protein [bacterium SCSIO 12741]|nr:CDP-alcohol phosphatidyltransferase family protein [bacterium SCSIO 12741]
MVVIRFIPNLFTLTNLFLGALGIVLCFEQQLAWAGVMIFIASVFDFLDGFVARALNAQSELGKQLDSIADMVTFGVLPGMILYNLILASMGCYFTPFDERSLDQHILSLSAFLLPLFAGLRLAKFNIDDRQTDSFIGVPTPAMAIFFGSLPAVFYWQLHMNIYVPLNDYALASMTKMLHLDGFDLAMISLVQSTPFLVACGVVFALLMVLPLSVISLKVKGLGWAGNEWRYTFIGGALLIIALSFIQELRGVHFDFWPHINWFCIPLIIVELLVLSGIKTVFNRN